MSITILENVSLQPYNTLAIAANARYFICINDPQQIPEAVSFSQQRELPIMVLGGGSNIVLSDDFNGVVLKLELLGISSRPCEDGVLLEVAAGENWHALVTYCLQQQYYGLENLALIPGTVGAAPIQNIGAYGVEIESRLQQVSGWNLQTASWQILAHDECQFGYRDSIFKRALKDRFIITAVQLKLSCQADTCTNYAALSQWLMEQGIERPTPEQVFEAVVTIRNAKLPDPSVLPNAGSFFKNPVVSSQQYELLLKRFPDLVSFPLADGSRKLAAGWLIEKAGWKGVEQDRAAIHKHQALVLINQHQGSGKDILNLAHNIQRDIAHRFGVELEIEPRIY